MFVFRHVINSSEMATFQVKTDTFQAEVYGILRLWKSSGARKPSLNNLNITVRTVKYFLFFTVHSNILTGI